MPTNMHLKIGTIKGESKKKGHEEQIEISSWAFGMDQQASVSHGSGSGAGRVQVRDIVLTKALCKADPALMKHCCDGTHLAEVTLYCEKAGGEKTVEYVKIVMKDVIVTHHAVTGATGGDTVLADVALNFAEYVFTYKTQDNKGGAGPEVIQGWNIPQNHKAA